MRPATGDTQAGTSRREISGISISTRHDDICMHAVIFNGTIDGITEIKSYSIANSGDAPTFIGQAPIRHYSDPDLRLEGRAGDRIIKLADFRASNH
jgi:hypothetical protein